MQALVAFYDGEILAVLLPDGRVAASLNSLCAILGISPHGQMQRIRRDEAIAEELVLAIVETPTRGPQRVDVLTAWAIPYWLTGLRLGMIAPEKRPAILRLKREAADVLYRHFFKIASDQTARSAEETPSEDKLSPQQMIDKGLHLLETGLQRMRQERQTMEQDIATLKTELANARQQLRGASAAGQRQYDSRPLSLEHIMQLYTLARSLERQNGEPVSALFRQLAEDFDVTDVSAIPDAGWEYVLNWFWQHTNAN